MTNKKLNLTQPKTKWLVIVDQLTKQYSPRLTQIPEHILVSYCNIIDSSNADGSLLTSLHMWLAYFTFTNIYHGQLASMTHPPASLHVYHNNLQWRCKQLTDSVKTAHDTQDVQHTGILTKQLFEVYPHCWHQICLLIDTPPS